MNPDDAVTPTDLIGVVRAASAAVRAAEAELIVLAAAWADANPDAEGDADNAALLRGHSGDLVPDIEPDHDPEGPDPRVPAMAWQAGASFAAALGVSTAAGEAMIRDALVLRHRLPRVWRRVLAHQVPVWRARRIAQAVAGRPEDVAAHLDRALAPVAEKVGPVILDRLIQEAMMLLYPEQRELAQVEALDARHATLHEESLTETGVGDLTIRGDWKDLHDFSHTLSEIAARLLDEDAAEDRKPDSLDVRRSRAVGVLADPEAAAALLARRPAPKPKRHTLLVLHLSHDAVKGHHMTGVVGRHETAGGPVLAQQVREWCGRTDTHLSVLPVLDLDQHHSVDRYEIPTRLDTQVGLLTPACAFPWCT